MITTLGITIAVVWLLLHFLVQFQNVKQIKELNDLPALTYALVLGAGLEKDGKPTDILSDRVLSAVKLIETGKARKLIMSGSSTGAGYDEVDAMERLAIQAGVDQNNILLDKAGNSTLDSLINFKNRFLSEKLVIVTQPFHLPRSLWLAGKLGLNGHGYPANIYSFSFTKRLFWAAREFFSIPFNLLKLIIFLLLRKIRPL
jgi:SanA protein